MRSIEDTEDALDNIDEAMGLIDQLEDILIELGDCKRIQATLERLKIQLLKKREVIEPYIPTKDDDALLLSIIRDVPRQGRLDDLTAPLFGNRL